MQLREVEENVMSNVLVAVDAQSRIATVTLNKQPLNICEQNFYGEIQAAFEQLNTRRDISVVILNSACKNFCAGGDLSEIQMCSNEENVAKISGAAVGCMGAIYSCKWPVIAAVNGKAIGAGVALAASCDVCIAAEDAVFSLPEITAGYIGASEFLQLLLPRRHARYYVFTGDAMTAQEMWRLGGVLDVVPAEKLMERAVTAAKRIADQSPLALAYFKEAMNHNDDERLAKKYMHEATYTLKYNSSYDCKETFAAFRERRKPLFRGE